MYELAKNKGYEFVCHTGNMIFVRKDYFEKLGVELPENPIYNFRRFWIQRNVKEYNKFLSN